MEENAELTTTDLFQADRIGNLTRRDLVLASEKKRARSYVNWRRHGLVPWRD